MQTAYSNSTLVYNINTKCSHIARLGIHLNYINVQWIDTLGPDEYCRLCCFRSKVELVLYKEVKHNYSVVNLEGHKVARQ